MLRPRRCFCCFNYLKSRDTDAYLTFLVFRFNHWNKKPFCSNNNNIKNSACKCQILCFYACIGAITCTQGIWYMFLKKYKSMLSTDDHNTTLLTFFIYYVFNIAILPYFPVELLQMINLSCWWEGLRLLQGGGIQQSY